MGESTGDEESLGVILGLDQLQYLSEITKALSGLKLSNSSGLNLRIAVSEEATDRVVGVWHNIEGQEWQLKIIS